MFAIAAWNVVGLYMTGMLSNLAGLDLGGIIFVAGSVLAVIMGLIGIIHSSVRIAGKCNCRGWIIGLLYVIAMLAAFAGSIFVAEKAVSFDVLLASLKNYTNIAALAVTCVPAIIHLIVAACSPRAKKCK
jgi:hypothetical protein